MTEKHTWQQGDEVIKRARANALFARVVRGTIQSF